MLYIKEKEICPVFISNHNLNYEKQILFLMIPNEEKEVGIIFLLKSISTFTMVIIVVQIVFILLQQKKKKKKRKRKTSISQKRM